MRDLHRWITNLYAINVALLFTHEIEGAYWKEWDMFGIPGDIREYLIVHFILLLAALLGFRMLLKRTPGGYVFSAAVAASGIVAFPIHAAFVLTGHDEFGLAISWIILGTLLALSMIQGYMTWYDWKKGSREQDESGA